MTEITLKEIPVQILSLDDSDVLILRCPPDLYDEQRYMLSETVRVELEKVGKHNPICVIGKDIDMATVTNIVKAREANRK